MFGTELSFVTFGVWGFGGILVVVGSCRPTIVRCVGRLVPRRGWGFGVGVSLFTVFELVVVYDIAGLLVFGCVEVRGWR